MPSCRVTNKTGRPLNICLKQVTALHFENTIKPDQEVKFKPGRVWFTLEAQVDDGSKSTRYSVVKSAATIGLLSIAVGAVAATAGAALLPEAATAGALAGASVAGSYLAKASVVTKGALVKNAGTIAKISSMAIPKAIERVSTEIGGLTALQKEVLSIIASPSLSSDVRHKATHILQSLYGAYTKDKTAPDRQWSSPTGPPGSAGNKTTAIPGGPGSTFTAAQSASSASQQEAATLSAQLSAHSPEERIETHPISSGSILRVHGIFMDRRRAFEVRVNARGELELWDKGTGARWDRKLEKQRDGEERAERKVKAKEEKEERVAREKEEKVAKEREKNTEGEPGGVVAGVAGAAAGLRARANKVLGGWGKKADTTSEKPLAETDGETTDEDAEGGKDDHASTTVVLDEEHKGPGGESEVKILERRGTVKERLDALVHPPPPPPGPSGESAQPHSPLVESEAVESPAASAGADTQAPRQE